MDQLGNDVAAATETTTPDYVDFVGTYSPVNIYTEAKTNLYLGAGNYLYYPQDENFQVNACRAYFKLKNGLTAGEPAGEQTGVRAIVLNFDGEDTQGIIDVEADSSLFTLHTSLFTFHLAHARRQAPRQAAHHEGHLHQERPQSGSEVIRKSGAPHGASLFFCLLAVFGILSCVPSAASDLRSSSLNFTHSFCSFLPFLARLYKKVRTFAAIIQGVPTDCGLR